MSRAGVEFSNPNSNHSARALRPGEFPLTTASDHTSREHRLPKMYPGAVTILSQTTKTEDVHPGTPTSDAPHSLETKLQLMALLCTSRCSRSSLNPPLLQTLLRYTMVQLILAYLIKSYPYTPARDTSSWCK